MRTAKLTLKQIKQALKGVADTVGKNKAGNYIARNGFYYPRGRTAKSFAEAIKVVLPATIINCGEVWKPFRGGATTAQSSHWWCEFTLEGLPS